MTTWLAGIIAAYVVGSIPFGVIIARVKGVNIRAHGSKNIGATNVWRVMGRNFGLLCFLLDALKGAIPVVVMGLIKDVAGSSPMALQAADVWMWIGVAVATVVGHMFSVFLGFRGGKGVATSFGALVAMWPLLTFPMLGSLIIWIVVVKLTRYVSVASMLAACAMPLGVLVGWIASWSDADAVTMTPLLVLTGVLAALVVVQHRANIGRLMRGEESRFGSKQVCGESPSDDAPSAD